MKEREEQHSIAYEILVDQKKALKLSHIANITQAITILVIIVLYIMK